MFNSQLSYLGLRAWGKRALALQAILLTFLMADCKRSAYRVLALCAITSRFLGLLLCLLLTSVVASAQSYPAPWPSSGAWALAVSAIRKIRPRSTAQVRARAAVRVAALRPRGVPGVALPCCRRSVTRSIW